ncbi:copine-8-like [Glandiceps talaboti]
MTAKASGQVGPFSEVELRLSARNLQDKDLFSDSDPFCVVYLKELCNNDFVEIGRTETVSKNLSPDFIKTFKLDYFEEEEQEIKFEVYDADSSSEKLSKHDYLGEVYCTLKNIVARRRLEIPIDFKGHTKRDRGTLIICVEDVGDCLDLVTLQFRANSLDKMDLFGKSDPFLTFHRINRDKSLTMVHRTEVIKKNLNPIWKSFTVPMKSLCCNDRNRKIIVNCWDWNKTGSDDYIGECEFTLNELTESQVGATDIPGSTYKFIDLFKKDKDKKYENSGFLSPMICLIEKRYSPMDFIRNGSRIHFLIAINPSAFNNNENLCFEILTSLRHYTEYYDPSRTFRIVGPEAEDLKKESPDCCCTGIEEVLKAYREDTQSKSTNDPFDLSGIMKNVKQIITDQTDKDSYFVVLILTDNCDVNSLAAARDAILQVENLPISTVLVNVGTCDSSVQKEMASLENGKSSGEEVKDVVHCVQVNKFIDQDGHVTSQTRLAREVFRQFPDDFMTWVSRNNVMPE